MTLIFKAFTKYLLGLILVSALIFLPAGSVDYIYGWLFIALLFIPILFLGIILYFKNPTLLEKRLNGKEKIGVQKGVVVFSALLFVVGFVVAGLDYRWALSCVPLWGIILASIVFVISYIGYAEVMRENKYLSRTIEVDKDQIVVDSGLYGIVRHPMYSVTVFMFLSIPIVLGSLLSLICFAVYIPIIIVRILGLN